MRSRGQHGRLAVRYEPQLFKINIMPRFVPHPSLPF
jgi:hypothetical protein